MIFGSLGTGLSRSRNGRAVGFAEIPSELEKRCSGTNDNSRKNRDLEILQSGSGRLGKWKILNRESR